MLVHSVGAADVHAAHRRLRRVATGKGEMSGSIAGEPSGSRGKHQTSACLRSRRPGNGGGAGCCSKKEDREALCLVVGWSRPLRTSRGGRLERRTVKAPPGRRYGPPRKR